MMRKAPPQASIAHKADGARLHAPSAERNMAPITDILTRYAPAQGPALEIASGTGQHVIHFARALPALEWQPTEIDPDRRASIAAWARDAARPNLRPPVPLDACRAGWAQNHERQALIVLVNLLHLISTAEARALISETAQALASGGRFLIYGPFLRAGKPVSDSDARFHASLQASAPEIGYKDCADVADWLNRAGLELIAQHEMPANNLTLIAEK